MCHVFSYLLSFLSNGFGQKESNISISYLRVNPFQKLLFSIFIGCFLALNLSGQTIPPERLTQWSNAGLTVEDLDIPTLELHIEDFGGVGNGIFDNSNAMNSALEFLADEGGIIHFGKGVYHFDSPIEISTSQVFLRGADTDSTTLTFEVGEGRDAISIFGRRDNLSRMLNFDALKGENHIELDSDGELETGDWVWLIDDDDEKVTSSWARGSTGQVLKIDSTSNNTLFLRSPLRRNFKVNREAVLHRIEAVSGVVIENLSIERLDKTDSQTSNILFQYAVDCQLKCVKSEKTNFAHVDVRFSSNIEVTGCYFADAHSHGGGGQAYGVVLHFGSGECLIRDNIFDHLRHSMLLQAGANGNVLAYNYSLDPFWEGTVLPSNSAGDAVLHGNYPFANLFEGNIIQQMVIDDSHGINGPHNIFFRNRAELYGLFMNNSPPSDSQVFVGNEITNTQFFLGNYLLFGQGHFEHGNFHKGDIKPPGTEFIEDNSLYLDTPPVWYVDQSFWPPIGFPNIPGSGMNRAFSRFESGEETNCNQIPVAVDPSFQWIEEVNIYPNPATDFIYVDSEQLFSGRIFDAWGRVIHHFNSVYQIDVSNLKGGVYTLELSFGDGLQLRRKIVVIRH